LLLSYIEHTPYSTERRAPPIAMIRLSPTSTAGRRAPGRHLFRSSLSTSASDDQSTIVGGPSLLTQTGVHRPSPSLFYLPGLRTLPFWTAPDDSSKLRIAFNDTSIKHAVEHVESNYKSIRQEYFGAVLGQGTSTDPLSGEIAKPLEPDYDLANKGGEHADGALHTGKLRLILGLPCQFLRDFEIQPQLPSPPHTYRPMGVAQLHS